MIEKQEMFTKHSCFFDLGILVHPIQWTLDSFWTSIEDAHINHRGLDILVVGEFLN